MSKNVYQIGSGELTFEIIERIINENLKLELAPEAKLRIQKCFGSLCTKNISPGELGTLQENLIKSHACSVGEEIRPVIIKLMMLLKAHALSLGHSGVQLITVQRILDFFNNDVLPIVYDRGSLGASGDLAPLALKPSTDVSTRLWIVSSRYALIPDRSRRERLSVNCWQAAN